MDKKKIIKFGCIGLVGILIIFGIIISARSAGNEDTSINVNQNNYLHSDIIIEIKGEVNQPGIYMVPSTAIISEVIVLAKGFTNSAYTDDLNLAGKVSDGMVIYVRKKDENSAISKVSINNGTLEELKTLPGIADAKAQAIISYRIENYGFSNLEELMNVKGISQATFDKIKDYITL